MRVLFLCNSHVWGGAEKYVIDVAHGLARRGHVCHVASPADSPLFQAAGRLGLSALAIDIGPKLGVRTAHEMAWRWPVHRMTLRHFLAECGAEYGIDVVHLQFKKEQLLGTAAAAELGLPVLWTEHGALPPVLTRVLPAHVLYRRAAARTPRILCISAFVARDLTRHGVDSQRLQVCYNGIDVTPTSATSGGTARSTVRGCFGIGPDDLVVGTTSRLFRIKGLHDLIDAGPMLIRRFSNLHLLIAGDGPARPALEQQAIRLGVAARVHFAGHAADVRPLLAASDVFAMPSRSEGLPFGVLEAMAAGLPVVATRVGGVPEALADGAGGLLVEPGRPDRLGRALATLLDDADHRARLGAAGRERVRTVFSVTRMIDETEAAFEAVACVQRGRGLSPFASSRPVAADTA